MQNLPARHTERRSRIVGVAEIRAQNGAVNVRNAPPGFLPQFHEPFPVLRLEYDPVQRSLVPLELFRLGFHGGILPRQRAMACNGAWRVWHFWHMWQRSFYNLWKPLTGAGTESPPLRQIQIV